MKAMMIVETRDPLDARDVEWSVGLMAGMHAFGIPATLMLAENGVLGARRDTATSLLQPLLDQGVEILADRFALAERGIAEAELVPGISGAELGVVVDRLVAGDSVIWR